MSAEVTSCEVTPLSVGHLAHLVLQVCGAEVRQAGVQRTAVHQAVHGRGWKSRLRLLRRLPQTPALVPVHQEVFQQWEELLTGRQRVSWNGGAGTPVT